MHSRTDFPDTEIREIPAKNTGGPYFELLSNSEAVTACDISGSIVPSPKPLYIACHQRCVSIIKRCIASQDAPPHRNVDESMRHLWLVLMNLFERASKDKMRPICNIYNAQAYGDIWRFQELVWEPSGDPETRSESEVHFLTIARWMLAILTVPTSASRSRPRRCARHSASDPVASSIDIPSGYPCIYHRCIQSSSNF